MTLSGIANAAVLWDTGAPHVVNFNGADTNLGYSSGNLGAGATERWYAMAFRIGGAGATINQVDADWFVVAGSQGATVEYKIWNRVGLTAPTTLYASGTLGAYGVGVDDVRTAGTDDWFHSYTGLNISIGAGDYYFTIHSAGIGAGNTTGASNLAWLTGADMQDEALERDGAWRSATFPTPGFVNYAPGNILAGTGMNDAEDRWNTSFALHGTAVPEPGTIIALALGGLALVARRRRA